MDSDQQAVGVRNSALFSKLILREFLEPCHTFTHGGLDGGYQGFSGLTLDSKGGLSGTSVEGGNLQCNPPVGFGTIFLNRAMSMKPIHSSFLHPQITTGHLGRFGYPQHP